jgi:hypothetical protein
MHSTRIDSSGKANFGSALLQELHKYLVVCPRTDIT